MTGINRIEAKGLAAAYQLLKERIEDKYAASDRQKEYYTAADGSMHELTKEKELEMLDSAYETHSWFMAINTQIWSELRDFKVQIDYHSGSAETETVTEKNQNADIKGQAYSAFMMHEWKDAMYACLNYGEAYYIASHGVSPN